MANNEWVCINDHTHRYDTTTAEQNSYFCPKCPFGEGILLQVDPDQEKEEEEEEDDNGGNGNGIVQPFTRIKEPSMRFTKEDLGLCMMLLDCSGSMKEPAFRNHPMTKKDLIAKSVSAGIFSLAGNPLREFAYILIIGFDHEIDIWVPFTSIEKIVEEYQTASGLERALKEKMAKKDGATDINTTLEVAFKFTQQFINSEISVLGDYKPRIQMVLDDNMVSHQIPNVRVLLFSDGAQYMGDDKTDLYPSPFKNLQYNGRTIDLLMSAYYGTSEDKDYHKLKKLASKCPRHPGTDQFFLFDHPSKVADLKGLFRMASGASGFCPKCLEEARIVTKDI